MTMMYIYICSQLKIGKLYILFITVGQLTLGVALLWFLRYVKWNSLYKTVTGNPYKENHLKVIALDHTLPSLSSLFMNTVNRTDNKFLVSGFETEKDWNPIRLLTKVYNYMRLWRKLANLGGWSPTPHSLQSTRSVVRKPLLFSGKKYLISLIKWVYVQKH